jgi:hypothetical protein
MVKAWLHQQINIPLFMPRNRILLGPKPLKIWGRQSNAHHINIMNNLSIKKLNFKKFIGHKIVSIDGVQGAEMDKANWLYT